jgi:hypothetical protein
MHVKMISLPVKGYYLHGHEVLPGNLERLLWVDDVLLVLKLLH